MLKKKLSASLFKVFVSYANNQVYDITEKLPFSHQRFLEISTPKGTVHSCSQVCVTWSRAGFRPPPEEGFGVKRGLRHTDVSRGPVPGLVPHMLRRSWFFMWLVNKMACVNTE